MGLEEHFDKLVEEWVEYSRSSKVQLSSSSAILRDREAYKKILSEGYYALPMIRRLYDKDSSNNFGLQLIQCQGLPVMVREIVGEDFQIPEQISGKIYEIRDYTKEWLDENMQKYLSFTGTPL